MSDLRQHTRSRVDSFTLAKMALTILTCEMASGNTDAAYRLWLGQTGDELRDMGNKLLEEAQTSVFDLRIDHPIAVWLHARNPDTEMALKAVNGLMAGVCADAAAHDRFLHALALRSWGLHLSVIFDDQVPPEAKASWLAACAAYGHMVEPRLFSLPRPSAWIIDWGEVASPPAPSPIGGKVESHAAEAKSMWRRLPGR